MLFGFVDIIYLQAAYYLVASIGIIFAVKQYKSSNKKRVLSDTIEISRLLREAQREFESNRKKDEKYYFIELLCTYEIACGLHNENLLESFTKEFIENYLAQNLENFANDKSLAAHLEVLRNDKGALDEVRSFIRNNNILFNEVASVRKSFLSY